MAPETSIDPHLRALAQHVKLPADAVAACLNRMDEAAPVFLALLERAAGGERLSDDEETLLFRGLHLLAAARDDRAFKSLLRLLHLPNETVEWLLGDGITETLPRVVASVFDGAVDDLLAIVLDHEIDEFVRESLFGAATFLTFQRQIDRDRMRDFLARFADERLAPDGDMAWVAWVHAVGLLGLRELVPRVEGVWAAKRLPDRIMDWHHFEEDLRDAERAPDDAGRFKPAYLGTIDDVAKDLAWLDDRDESSENPFDGPVTNRYRDVGRNDPCPCGSGKKFKKCCLAA